MNKGAIAIIVIALGLGVYLLVRPDDTVEAAKPMTIDGYLEDAAQAEWRDRKENPIRYLSEKEEDRKKKFKPAPYDELVVERDGGQIRVTRKAEDQWTLVEPATSEVETFRLKAMIEPFATDTALTPARTVKNPDLLSDFGLDERRAIKVTLKEQGQTKVQLTIGNRVKVEDGDESGGQDRYDTFVMLPDQPNEVYRAKLKDLRQPYELQVSELRNKKLFTFDLTAISKVTVEDPSNEKHPTIAVKAEWEEAKAAPKEGDEEAKQEERKADWTLLQPQVADFPLENMRSWWNALAGLRVNEFVMEEPPAETGLTDPAKRPRVTLELSEGDPKTHTIVFGEPKEKDKTYYAMIEGSGEYFVITKYTRDNLLKTLPELRNKNVLEVDDDADITRIEIQSQQTGGAPMVFERQGEGWKMTQPVEQVAWAKEMKNLVSGLRYLRVTDFIDKPADPAAAGLATPSMTLKVTVKGQEKVLLLGEERDSKVTAHLQGTDLYFTLGSWAVDKFEKGPADFKDHSVMDVQPTEVQSLKLVHPEETVELSKVPGQDLWQMTAPEQLEAGKGLSENTVKGLVATLKGLEARAFSDKTPEQAGLTEPPFKLVATLADGSTREIHLSDATEGEDPFMAAVGPKAQPGQVYVLDKYKAKNLRKKAADLKSGN